MIEIEIPTKCDRSDERFGDLCGGGVEDAARGRVSVTDGVGVEAPQKESQHGRRAGPEAVASHHKLKGQLRIHNLIQVIQ